jgi:DNA-binding beta-propeller fold protein YncE
MFATNGNLVTMWGSDGSLTSQFAAPGGIAVDEHGFVYVADQNNNRIQKFAPCP